MRCEITIDTKPFSFDVEGEFFWGKDEVLFKKESNVIENAAWLNEGYGIVEILNTENQLLLNEVIKNLITEIFDELNVKYDKKNFRLEDYHHYVSDNKIHNEIIKKTRFLTQAHFPRAVLESIRNNISDCLKKNVSFDNPLLEREILILRISRPKSLDINPPHRDGYLDIWKNVLNLWIPLVGCDKNSSLPLISGSHLWNEKDIYRTDAKGAYINGLQYHVPGIIKSTQGLNMIRPNPKYGQALIFTPFIIHGAAVNLNEDATRMSLELRLYKTN